MPSPKAAHGMRHPLVAQSNDRETTCTPPPAEELSDSAQEVTPSIDKIAASADTLATITEGLNHTVS